MGAVGGRTVVVAVGAVGATVVGAVGGGAVVVAVGAVGAVGAATTPHS